MKTAFEALDQQEAIFLSHYQLSAKTNQQFSPDEWRLFLQHPKVAAWMDEELRMYKDFQLKQLIRGATDNDRSVGAAQMINSLTKTLADSKGKEGPIIIYTHVPVLEAHHGSTVDIRQTDPHLFDQFINQGDD